MLLIEKFFIKIFGHPADKKSITDAIAAFERTLETSNSAFDHYISGKDTTQFSDAAKRGRVIFNVKGKCFDCHFGPDFTTDLFRNIGLFNGKDLSGWKVLGGKATYTVEDGVITGHTVANTFNTFLCTEKEYGDFVLELDVYVEDEEGNSGIQTRSHFDPAANKGQGRVYGRQCEVDPSWRRWTGGVYDEGRREWIYPMQLHAAAQNLYKKGEFNHFKVECIGNQMKTWVNGVADAYVVDTLDAKGFIGLQVHAISDPTHAGKKVCFKNIRIKTTGIVPTPFPANVYVANFAVNSLTDYEKKDGWKLLFDGKTNNGWIRAYQDHFPAKGWAINNGEITVLPSNGNQAGGGGILLLQMNMQHSICHSNLN